MPLGSGVLAQTMTVIVGFIIATIAIRYVLSAKLDRSWETDYVDDPDCGDDHTAAAPAEHRANPPARHAA